MNSIKLSECCGANLDSIVLVPAAFGKNEVKSHTGPFVEELQLGKSGRSVDSPFFLYFSHTPYKREVKENLNSLVKALVERKIPIFGDQHSYGLLTGNIVTGMDGEAASPVDDVMEAVEYIEEGELRDLYVSQLTPDRRGVDISYLGRNLGVELKLGFDREEAAAVKDDQPSPRHLDVRDLNELRSYVHLLKEATGYSVSVFVSVRGDSVYDICFEAIEGMADAVILRCSNPVVELPGAVDAFKDTDAKKQGVKLLVVAPVRDAEDIMKLRALGADAVGFDVCELVQAVKNRKGLEKHLDSLETELKRRMLFYGINELATLNEDFLRALDYNTAAVSGLKLIGYDRKLPMWLH